MPAAIRCVLEMTCVEIPRIDADERGLGKAELSPRRHGDTENSRKIAKVGKNPTTDEQGWEKIAKIAEIEKQKLYRGLTRMFADWEKAELSPRRHGDTEEVGIWKSV
jgi:hypothetical protein